MGIWKRVTCTVELEVGSFFAYWQLLLLNPLFFYTLALSLHSIFKNNKHVRNCRHRRKAVQSG